jgi:tetratricopeptide (TPR) repeat protein
MQQSLGSAWAERALLSLAEGDSIGALEAAKEALALADKQLVERDFVRAHWLLGAAHRANGDMEDADRHLSEALTRCRSINVVEHEADILLDLARLRAATRSFDSAQDDREEALRLAQEALVITERCGYVLQGADVHLFLAQMALEDGEKETALFHAREARRLATCDGPPDYTYKVAYDEAGALLAQLGEKQRMESG